MVVTPFENAFCQCCEIKITIEEQKKRVAGLKSIILSDLYSELVAAEAVALACSNGHNDYLRLLKLHFGKAIQLKSNIHTRQEYDLVKLELAA